MVIDITGLIYDGMWSYGEPFPDVKIIPLSKVPWLKNEIYCEIFEGLGSQTGTYLETPAHFYGNKNSYLLADVDVGRLVNIDCVVLKLDGFDEVPVERRRITEKDLESSPQARLIRPGDALLVATGWGNQWTEPWYLSKSPYFSCGAVQWLIEKKPFILGGDLPRWENLNNMEGFFPMFYAADILMLSPCVNLERVKEKRVKLTALPLRVVNTSCAPCRAVIAEDD